MTQPNDVGPSESTKRLMLSPNDELIETIKEALTSNAFKIDYTTELIKEWLRALLEERKTHAPHGRNYTNEQYVNLRNQLEQLREETGMVNALNDSDNLDLRTQLQKTREELERAISINTTQSKMFQKLEDRHREKCAELERVKAERDEVRKDAFISRERLARFRTELAALNKLLEEFAIGSPYATKHKARSILSQYKGADTHETS